MTWGIVVFVSLGLGFGAHSLTQGDYPLAAVLIGMQLPFLLLLIAVQRVARGHTALSGNADSSGTTLRADRTFSIFCLVAFAAFIPVGAVVVVFTLTGDLHMFESRRGKIASVVSMGSASVIATNGLISARRRRGLGYVKLTPTGIDIADILHTKSVTWSEIVSVDDEGESKKTRKAVVLNRSDGSESVIDGADIYVPEGAGLYWMIQHYWRHLDDRAELVDGRALQRLQEGRFDVDDVQA